MIKHIKNWNPFTLPMLFTSENSHNRLKSVRETTIKINIRRRKAGKGGKIKEKKIKPPHRE